MAILLFISVHVVVSLRLDTVFYQLQIGRDRCDCDQRIHTGKGVGEDEDRMGGVEFHLCTLSRLREFLVTVSICRRDKIHATRPCQNSFVNCDTGPVKQNNVQPNLLQRYPALECTT